MFADELEQLEREYNRTCEPLDMRATEELDQCPRYRTNRAGTLGAQSLYPEDTVKRTRRRRTGRKTSADLAPQSVAMMQHGAR
jgi:hypothetical protein